MMKKIMIAVFILVLLWMGVSFFGGIFTRSRIYPTTVRK